MMKRCQILHIRKKIGTCLVQNALNLTRQVILILDGLTCLTFVTHLNWNRKLYDPSVPQATHTEAGFSYTLSWLGYFHETSRHLSIDVHRFYDLVLELIQTPHTCQRRTCETAKPHKEHWEPHRVVQLFRTHQVHLENTERKINMYNRWCMTDYDDLRTNLKQEFRWHARAC